MPNTYQHPGFLNSQKTTLAKGKVADPVIAGKKAGKRVLCSQQALPIFNDLVKLANNGNYWAGLIVNGINGLTVGRLAKDNIYIEKKAGIAYGKGAFYLVLPGVTATLEDRPDGTYMLMYLKADTNYMALQEDSMEPGLWRVKANERDKPDFQHDGQILEKDYRPVVITGMASDDPHVTAGAIRKDLIETDTTMKRIVQGDGFDMHYTRGTGSIVGLKKASKALAGSRDREIVKSAILLANTMYQARNIKGVLWYSDWGGSAVLTRALQILSREKGLKELKKHAIFLNRPTTSDKEIKDLAKQLGLESSEKKTGWTLDEIQGHILHIEVGANKETGKSLVSATGQGLSVAGASYGIAGAMLAVAGSAITLPGSMVLGLAGGLFTVAGLVRTAGKKLKSKKY